MCVCVCVWSRLLLFSLFCCLFAVPVLLARRAVLSCPWALSLAVPWVEAAILAALRGDVPKYVVNKDALPKWQSRFGGQSLI